MAGVLDAESCETAGTPHIAKLALTLGSALDMRS
jgi:hypothetical protein